MRFDRVGLAPLLLLLSLRGPVQAAPDSSTLSHTLHCHGLQDQASLWQRLLSRWAFRKLERLDSPTLSTNRDIRTRRDRDLLLRFNISTVREATALADVADRMFLDVWDSHSDWTDIRVADDTLPQVLQALPESLQHSHTLLLDPEDLNKAIHDTYPSPRPLPLAVRPFSPALHRSTTDRSSESGIFFDDYQPLPVIQHWLELIASLFTTYVRLVKIGSSAQGRDILAARIGVHPHNNQNPLPPRRTVIISGGTHAREWITTSTITYLIHRLATGYGRSEALTSLLQSFDFVLIPTLNPDGYVYSWDTDRLWRKTRQQVSSDICLGLDLDHTFPFEWSSDSNPCSESYAGTQATQANETRALVDWIEAEKDGMEIVAFLDIHSYSQQILYPYSYSCAHEPNALEDLEELGTGLAKAIRVGAGGHDYEVASACRTDVLAQTTLRRGGSAIDWFYHSVGVKFSYQIKLRDRGSYGFLLPSENIVPSGREMFEAVVYLAKYLNGDLEDLGLRTPEHLDTRHADLKR